MVEILVTQDNVEVDTKHNSDHWHGRLPLSYTAQYGRKVLVKMLVLNVAQDSDVEVDTKDK